MDISKKIKGRLLLYVLISTLSYSYLVLSSNAGLCFPFSVLFQYGNSGIGVPLFILLQGIMMFFIVPRKRRILFLVPVFLISLNYFISGSRIWHESNFIICFFLIGCMFFDFNFKDSGFGQFPRIISKIFSPFRFFSLPFIWLSERKKEKSGIMKRILLALLITVPSIVILILILASADMVFSFKAEGFISSLTEILNFTTVFKLVLGSVAGLYLFGAVCNAYSKTENSVGHDTAPKCDILIINIFLSAVLLVYTLFVIIQFTYLFTGSSLPAGLTYTEYARKGFFELLALTAVNIVIILAIKRKTRNYCSKWSHLTNVLCTYLCAVTVVLLVSSFYRMYLYTQDDGLTRLRLFVMGFLAFELLGLIATFIYIIKPKFNIMLIYMIIALCYYTLLNIIPTDNIIARNQIDKYLNGEREDLNYVFTLSSDAAPSMKYLYENTDDENLKREVRIFLEIETYDKNTSWQNYNYSIDKAQNITSDLE